MTHSSHAYLARDGRAAMAQSYLRVTKVRVCWWYTASCGMNVCDAVCGVEQKDHMPADRRITCATGHRVRLDRQTEAMGGAKTCTTSARETQVDFEHRPTPTPTPRLPPNADQGRLPPSPAGKNETNTDVQTSSSPAPYPHCFRIADSRAARGRRHYSTRSSVSPAVCWVGDFLPPKTGPIELRFPVASFYLMSTACQ